MKHLQIHSMALAWTKIALVLVYLACDHQAISDRVSSLGVSLGLGMYAMLYGMLALGLFAAAFVSRTPLRIALALVLAGGSVALQTYEWSTAQPLDYNAFETMFASRGDVGDAYAQHGGAFWKSLGVALLLLIGIGLPPGRVRAPQTLVIGAPILGLAVLATMLFLRGGEGGRALPAPFVPLAHAVIMGAVTLAEPGGTRQAVAAEPAGPTPQHDIVLIVDESIAANYLDINHADGVRSGLATAPQGVAIHNFGVAASVTNCSAGTNKTLRFGGRRETYRVAARSLPSVWAYAHKAGLRTVYMDGQRTGGTLQNLATPEERAEIDDLVQLPDVPVAQRDMALAQLLRERFANKVPEFIYVNKVGAHFPVAAKFPESFANYQPTLPRAGAAQATADMSAIQGESAGDAHYWRLYRNAYRNTLLWSVGAFFDRLLTQHDPTRAVIVYTSDHGQDLYERGRPGKASHCNSDPRPEEAAVPMVVIDSAAAPRLAWAQAVAAHHNATSHFQIFPTVLALMGYATGPLEADYGPTLVAQAKDPLMFTINYFAALGRAPIWRKIVPSNLAAPPRSDAGTPAPQ